MSIASFAGLHAGREGLEVKGPVHEPSDAEEGGQEGREAPEDHRQGQDERHWKQDE